MMRAAVLIAALGLLTAGDRSTQDLAKALAGRTPGKAANCLSSSRDSGPTAYGDRTLLYRDGTRLWRNDLPDACPGLDDDSIVVSEIFGGQLCRGDTFYTIQRSGIGIPGPRCRLGAFVPWEKTKT